MKKTILLLLLSCFYYSGFSQSTTAATYALSTQTGTYDTVVGGTDAAPTGGDLDDGTTTGISIGFSFVYCGATYTTLSASQNGYISLANSTVSGTGSGTYQNTAAELATIGATGILMPFWDDLTGNANGVANSTACTGVISRYVTTGSAPNRVFTFEWYNFGAYHAAPSATATGCGSIQVKLYETTNTIEFWYANNTFANMSATIGIANSTTDYKLVSSNTAFPATVTAGFPGTSLTATPATTIVYRWCPQNINPTAAVGGPYCSGVTATLTASTTAGASYSWVGPNSFSSAVQDPTIPDVTVAAAGIYTLTETIGSCMANTVSPSMVVNQTPLGITGGDSVCAGGGTLDLASATAGGVWSSGTPAHSTIVGTGATAVVTGVGAGASLITYKIAATGCDTTLTVTTQTAPTAGAITGTTTFCQGANSTLADATGTAGGTWSSSNSAIVTVSAGGVAGGVAGGTATVSYTVSNSCGTFSATKLITINPLPALGAIGGTTTFCNTTPTTLTDAPSGGTWTSTTLSVATVDATGKVFGITAGTDLISYTLTNGCGSVTATTTVTIQTFPYLPAISGASAVCQAATTGFTDATSGGTWSSSNSAVATIDGVTGTAGGVVGGTVNITYTFTNTCGTSDTTTPLIVVPFPGPDAITGPGSVCAGSNITLHEDTLGGVWTSGAVGIATIDPSSGIVGGVSAGSAPITYTATNSCGSTQVFTSVTVNPLPVAGSISGVSTVCVGANTTLIDGAGGGTWSSLNSATATVDAALGTVGGVATDTVSIVYTVTNGCGTATTSDLVTVNPIPVPGTITGASPICLGASTSYTETVPAGTWSSNNVAIATIDPSSGLLTGSGVGSTTITYTVTTGCGTVNTTAPITVNTTTPSAGTITGTFSVCPGNSVTLGETLSGGTWSSSNSAIATVDPSSGTVTGVSAAGGSVNIIYTVTTACGTGTAIQAFTVNPTTTAGTITGVTSVCVGSSTSLSDGTSGGSWSSATPSVATVDGSGNVFGVTAGTANILYTVTTVCGTAVATQPVTVLTVPGAGSISGSSSVCVGASVSLSDGVSGGVWSSSNSAIVTIDPSSGSATGVSAGSVTIIYTVSNVCGSNNTTFGETAVLIPSAGSITGSSNVCVGSTISLSDGVSGGAWLSSNSSIATVDGGGTVGGVDTGTVTISYLVGGSCGTGIATATITVGRFPSGGDITGVSSVCVGSTITLSDGVSGGVWSSGNSSIATISAGGVVNPVSAGADTIYYTVTNACGSAGTSFPIMVISSPSAGAITGMPSICIGTAVTLSDAVSGGTWSSSNTSVASVSPSGVVSGVSTGAATISYSVTTSCGTAVATRAVVSGAFPNAGTITGSTTACVGTNTTYSDTAVGGVWSSSDTTIATVNSSGVVTGVDTGSVNIYYSVTNSCGSANVTILIHVINPPSTGTITGSSLICVSGSETLTETVSGGTWVSGTPAVATINSTGLVIGLTSGTSVISYGISSVCGITYSTFSLSVTPGADPGTVGGPTTICQGTSRTLTETVAAGIWSSSNTAVATISSTGVISGVSAGTTVIAYTVSSSCGSTSATATITISPLTSAGTISGPALVCEGSAITLSDTVSGGTWTSANTSIATVNASGSVGGVDTGNVTISYTVTDACGTATATANVAVSSAPFEGIVTGTTTVCEGGVDTLGETVAGGTWTSGNVAIATVNASGIVSGVTGGSVIISYTVTNSCGTGVATAFLTVNPFPAPGAISGPASVCTGVLSSYSESISGGSWSSGSTAIATISTSGVLSPVATGTTILSYTQVNACGTTVTTDTVLVKTVPGSAGTISGASSVCPGDSIVLTDATAGGTWSSSNTAIASVSTAGGVHGVTAGSVNITYTITNSCGSISTENAITVNTSASAGSISVSSTSVCAGATATATDGVSGGVWSSSDVSVATVDTTGLVTGVAIGGGSATISYTVTNSCGTGVATAVFNVLAAPALSAISGSSPICQGTTATYSDTYFGGTWASSNTSVATINSATGSLSALTPGVTTLSYSASNVFGCHSMVTDTVTVNPAPSAGTLGGSTTTVCANTTISFTDGVTGGTWSSSNTSIATVDTGGVVTGVAAGDATISYTYTNSCGTVSTSVDITVDPAPVLTGITGPASACTGVTYALSNTTFGGVWSSSNPSAATVDASSGMMTGVAAGTTTISYVVTNVFSCSSMVTLGETVNTTANPGTLVVTTTTLCAGAASVAFTDDTTGGVWSSSDTTVANVDASGNVSGVSPGTATISYTVSNASGCDASVSATVTVNPTPSIGPVTGATSLCLGSSTTLSDVTSSGTWSSMDTTIAIVDPATGKVTGVSLGTTTISYTLLNVYGCSNTSVYPDTVSAVPSAGTISGPTSICTGSPIAFTNGATGGTWISSNMAIATVNDTGLVSPVSAGYVSISYFVSTSVGCNATATQADTVNLSPTVDTISGPIVICAGIPTAYTETSAGGFWSSGAAAIAMVDGSGNVTGESAGTGIISYSITDGLGCTTIQTKTFTVNPSPVPSIIAGSSDACLGTTTLLSDTLSGGVWSTSNTTVATIDPSTGVLNGVALGMDTVSYVVTNSFSCSGTVSIVETVHALPAAGTISGPSYMCQGRSITLSDGTGSGTWSSADSAVASPSSTGVISGASAGTVNILYTVTDAFHCNGAASKTITVNPTPVVGIITGTTTVCIGSSTTLVDTPSAGVWSSSASSIATVGMGSGVVVGLAAGTATISYSVTNSFACTSGAATTITVIAPPSVGSISGLSSACPGDTLTLANSDTGGTWSSSNLTVATINSHTGFVSAVSGGSTTISYTIGSAGCSSTATTVETVHPAPSAGMISGTSGVCIGDSVTLTDGAGGGNWSSSNMAVASISGAGIVKGITSGTDTITYTVTSGSGCISSTTFPVTVNAAPSGTLMPTSGSATLCNGTPVTLDVTGAIGTPAYQWYKGGIAISGATGGTYIADSTGTYSVALSESGCSVVLAGNVNILTSPDPIITKDTGTTILSTGSFATYQWYRDGAIIIGATNSSFTAPEPGSYTVVVTDINGCTVTSGTYVLNSDGVANVIKNSIKMYPNPASAMITIEAPVKVNVSIVSPDGKVVLQQNRATTIDVSSLANGLYLIMIYDEGNNLLKADKFIKEN